MTTRSFVHSAHAQRVVFGQGSVRALPDELDKLGVRRALVLCTSGQTEQAQSILRGIGSRGVGLHDGAAMHVPVEVARSARAEASKLNADVLLAVGGGSTIGLAKAIALESGLPIVAVPTTYAGSEMTSIYGLTEGGLKRTGRDIRVLPRTVVYDPALTYELPAATSVVSGLNAIAHASEALYASDSSPITDLMAVEGLTALARALPLLADRSTAGAPVQAKAREDALYGAWLCGAVLGAVSMALHHKLCHTLGGTFGLPHAETHAVVLPHALAYNANFARPAMERIATALNGRSAPAAAFDLAHACGAPCSLRELGLSKADLQRATDLALQNQYPNPRPLEAASIAQLLRDAFDGVRPN